MPQWVLLPAWWRSGTHPMPCGAVRQRSPAGHQHLLRPLPRGSLWQLQWRHCSNVHRALHMWCRKLLSRGLHDPGRSVRALRGGQLLIRIGQRTCALRHRSLWQQYGAEHLLWLHVCRRLLLPCRLHRPAATVHAVSLRVLLHWECLFAQSVQLRLVRRFTWPPQLKLLWAVRAWSVWEQRRADDSRLHRTV
jgi:hypothetical protein